MDTYSFLRQFADSWAMLSILLTFLGVIVYVFRPGSRSMHDEAANSIFRNDTKPADGESPKAHVKEA